MLDSAVEAEDVVQDAWLRWQGTDRSAVLSPVAFLSRTTTRLAINVAQSARSRRQTCLGPWLPEPVNTTGNPEAGVQRAEELEHALLLVLETLPPTERAVYLLREAFDYGYADIAAMLRLSAVNVRQIASRARRRLAAGRRGTVDAGERRLLLAAFLAAARTGEVGLLESLLVPAAAGPSGPPARRGAHGPGAPGAGAHGPDVQLPPAQLPPAVQLTGQMHPVLQTGPPRPATTPRWPSQLHAPAGQLGVNPKPALRRAARPAAAALTAALALTALGAPPAASVVPPDKVTWVIHKLDDNPAHSGGGLGRDRYFSTVTQLRNWMAGPTIRGDVRLSQADTDGIIGIDVRDDAGARLVTVFLNPHSGYLTGFHTRGGVVYYFSDANPAMVSEMKGYARSIGAGAHRLHLSGSFDAWYAAATGGGLPAPTVIGTRSFRDAASSLGNSPGPEYIDRFLPQTAQYLLVLSPAYAQATHYTLFRDRVGAALANNASSAVVLDDRARELRSNWEKINNDTLPNIVFLADDRSGGNDLLPFPVTLGPVNGSLRTFAEVLATLRILTNTQGRE